MSEVPRPDPNRGPIRLLDVCRNKPCATSLTPVGATTSNAVAHPDTGHPGEFVNWLTMNVGVGRQGNRVGDLGKIIYERSRSQIEEQTNSLVNSKNC